jgi:hypothetical protein
MHAHQFTEGDRSKKQGEAPHISNNLPPLSIFMLYFAPVTDLLVTETITNIWKDATKCQTHFVTK